MKFSKYNTLVPHNENYIFYNSFTNKFLYVNLELQEIIENAIKESNPYLIHDIHEELYEELVKSEYIIDNGVDEYQKVVDRINDVNSNKENFKLIINPTLNCNFNCWYCYENKSKPSKMDNNIFERVKLYIKNICEDHSLKNFELSFFGGEPLLHYKKIIQPLSEYAYKITQEKKKNLLITITTNGFLINNDLIDELKKWGLGHVQITFDGNRNKHDKTRFVLPGIGSYDIIVNNLKKLARDHIHVTMRVNYTEDNLDGLAGLLDSFDDLSLENKSIITLSMNKVWQEVNEDLSEKVSEFEKLAQEKGFSLPDALVGNTVMFPCYADKDNEAVVNFDGNVFKCNARDFTDNRKDGVLDESGRVLWNENYILRKKVQLTNKPCMECSIFPICGGGCSQNALELYGKNYCIHRFDKKIIHNIITNMFLSVHTLKD